jgi:L,D-peptidoglycan transpeptidase YkuD (ErfK/YbiS/YcfS/YnhG family)
MIFALKENMRSSRNCGELWFVRRKPGRSAHLGLLETGIGVYPCSLGRAGITTRKREGDGGTPAGLLRILGGYRHPKRLGFSPGARKLAATKGNLGWCDDPASAAYNRAVRLPFSRSHERMQRDDRLYDACLVLDWNYTKRARNRGSAIFLHMSREDQGPTAGCIALDPALFTRLLPRLLRGVAICVLP